MKTEQEYIDSILHINDVINYLQTTKDNLKGKHGSWRWLHEKRVTEEIELKLLEKTKLKKEFRDFLEVGYE